MMTDGEGDLVERDLVGRAAAYARELHAGDTRKGTGVSYFAGHLAPVAQIVRDNGGDDVQVAAAYLHDAAEDHGGQARLEDVRKEFGADVATIVEHLSDSLVATDAGQVKESWRIRKERYIASLAHKPRRSLEVAAADKLHNASSIVADHREIGDELWKRFTTSNPADHRWYYRSLADALHERLPGHPTVAALRETVDQLERQLGGTGGASDRMHEI